MFEDLVFPVLHSSDDSDILPYITINEKEDESGKAVEYPGQLPVLALKNTVLFPGVVIPITVGRTKSVKAVKKAYEGDKLVAVFSQLDPITEDPMMDDLYRIGTTAKIIKLLTMPDGSTTAILQGKRRCHLNNLIQVEPFLLGAVDQVPVMPNEEMEFKATMSSIKDTAKQIIELSPQIPKEALVMLQNIKGDSFLLNFIASNINIPIQDKQKILEIETIKDKATVILKKVDQEMQMLKVKGQIESKVRGDIERQQRDYFLNQQLKTIQDELGDNPQKEAVAELKLRAADMNWPEYAAKQFEKQIAKIQRINPQVAEYSVTLNYLELMLDLPWEKFTEDNFDLKSVSKTLDEDHYGLQDVKERILEHLAVLKLKGDMKAPIILLVGPPGVGKTSLGKSVAKALKREFIRMSLGGLHDESEIRGHRKTYIGAMPGRILQSLKKAGSSNPVFILDEIDKVGKDFRGDPSSALLEVLDPEQNSTFYDNYLELDYDLSKVMFIATANSLNTIQSALLDRMEVINVSGYSTEEKIEIAKKHLVPKQRKAHGLKASDATLSKATLANLISDYTRESGVRSLDRVIAGVMRKVAKHKAMDEAYDKNIKPNQLADILGPAKFTKDESTKISSPGVAIGLAWTQVGGDILFIETSLSAGKGKLILTGNLGDVMKESATTALSYIKANAKKLGIDAEEFNKYDIHVHVPQGAIPKDGPSAGITMMTSISSAFLKKKVKRGVAMSGEITLRGRVLPVGGIKEKVLAAKRAGLKEVILCNQNEKDIKKINEEFIKDMSFKFVENMDDVLEYVL